LPLLFVPIGLTESLACGVAGVRAGIPQKYSDDRKIEDRKMFASFRIRASSTSLA
jgi:hypothetical protein